MNKTGPRVAVIGGGISGLTAAYELTLSPKSPRITLFEAESRLGGVLQTELRDGWLIDQAADNFIVDPNDAIKLCEDLGVAEQLIEPRADDRRAMVVFHGQPMEIPEGLALMRPTRLRAVLSSPLLSWQAKLRLMTEPLKRPKRDESDESLANFVRRRLGQEFLDRIVQPLIAGIYTGDAEQLSVQATVPQVVKLEREYGSLLRGTLALRRSAKDAASRQASGARYGQFRAFPNGTATLINALTVAIRDRVSIRKGLPVHGLTRSFDNNWHITSDAGEESFDAVICALPAPRAARLLASVSIEVTKLLSGIPYASSAIVLLGIRAVDLQRPLEGFGLVVPEIEHRQSIAISFADRKYPGRSPPGCHLLRVFMGGAMHPEMMLLSDEELINVARREVSELLGVRGEPMLTEVVRWVEKMPQYHVGHLDRVRKLRHHTESLPGLKLVGNAYDGVGIPQCVKLARNEARGIKFQSTGG